MAFVFISGRTPEEVEENFFKYAVNMSAKIERLRQFVGLDTNNMMRIVATAADVTVKKCDRAKKANA